MNAAAYLFKGIRQSQDAGSYEGYKDVGENFDTTVCPVIVHPLGFANAALWTTVSSVLYLDCTQHVGNTSRAVS